MCHRRTDWSRTSNRASVPADEDETERDDRGRADRSPWPARARERLAALVPTGAWPAGETPEPFADEGSVTEREPTTEPESDPSESDDEREEEPIPADD